MEKEGHGDHSSVRTQRPWYGDYSNESVPWEGLTNYTQLQYRLLLVPLQHGPSAWDPELLPVFRGAPYE